MIREGHSIKRAVLVLAMMEILGVCPTRSFGQELRFDSLKELISVLEHSSLKEQSRLATLMHLSSYASDAGFVNCELTAQEDKLERSSDNALIQVRCLDKIDLLALRNIKGRWEWLDSFAVWNVYNKSKIETLGLIEPPVQEILVHNNCSGHGTGLYWGQFLILKLLNGHFRVIYASLENATEKPVANAPGRSLLGTFKLIPASRKGPAEIEETAVYSLERTQHKVKRIYFWNDQWMTFTNQFIDSLN